MGYPTPIEWTDATWNPIGGCSVKSPGCKPCYAMQLAGTRLRHHPLYAGTTSSANGRPVFNGTMTALAPEHPAWRWPQRWRGATNPKLGPGRPSLIFVGDMADLFHESRSVRIVERVVDAILVSNHVGQLLTKRPEAMLWFFKRQLKVLGRGARVALLKRRLWLGVSAERQREFDERWPHLRELAEIGFTVFVSYEPALGPLVLPDDALALGDQLQVIAGGTSGRRAAVPFHPKWALAIRDQCAANGVAFFFKQWGEYLPGAVVPDDSFEGGAHVHVAGHGMTAITGAIRLDDGLAAVRVGTKKAGAMLEGREWRQFPRLAG